MMVKRKLDGAGEPDLTAGRLAVCMTKFGRGLKF